MLDVFVVTFVVALIQFEPLMSDAPEYRGPVLRRGGHPDDYSPPKSFDPRLIWDSSQGKQETND